MITHDELKRVLRYDPLTGLFVWLVQPSPKVKVGAIAGSTNRRGYCEIKIFNKCYLAHRLAWFYVHGRWPTKQIDHRDMSKSNNRISNLRDVSHATNQQNRRAAQRNNKSNLLGVHQAKGRFRAQIGVNGGVVRLGRFKTPEAAHAAYLEAKRTYHASPLVE